MRPEPAERDRDGVARSGVAGQHERVVGRDAVGAERPCRPRSRRSTAWSTAVLTVTRADGGARVAREVGDGRGERMRRRAAAAVPRSCTVQRPAASATRCRSCRVPDERRRDRAARFRRAAQHESGLGGHALDDRRGRRGRVDGDRESAPTADPSSPSRRWPCRRTWRRLREAPCRCSRASSCPRRPPWPFRSTPTPKRVTVTVVPGTRGAAQRQRRVAR